MTLSIAVEPFDEVAAKIITDSLIAFNRAKANRPEPQKFLVLLRDEARTVRGGISAALHYDVLYIDDLFVEEAFRGQDHGTKLIRLAEEEGRKRGARLVWLDTYSWQARPFYEKQGYEVFGELPYWNGTHRRHFMKKAL
ncbi:MAG TPA: GNAT family N-acetyltransferase [Rhizomicrobium sp.]|nr:GNAT family N-acetyltransferase [Rhizomicrobium sp.]